VTYSRVRPTREWRTLEYVTTKEEYTLESKSCLESVAAPTPAATQGTQSRYAYNLTLLPPSE